MRRIRFVLLLAIAALAMPAAAVSTPPPAPTPLDLGTLGGSYSVAVAINSGGQVVGLGPTASGAIHPFSWTASSGMVDLGTLGGSSGQASAVADSGQVVGHAATTSGFAHGFSWTAAGGMVDIGTLPGGSSSDALAVNSHGQVAGWSDLSGGGFHPVVWTQAGGMVDLGTLGGTAGQALAISESGQVVGWTTTANGDMHAFSWTPGGGMVDLGGFGGTIARAEVVNGAGLVGGYSLRAGNAAQDAFTWTAAGGLVDIGANGDVKDVSETGQVVGTFTTLSSQQAFSWTAAGGTVLLSEPGFSTSLAAAVNDQGLVVGFAGTSRFSIHPVAWTPSGVVDLAGVGGAVAGVNDSGQIAGAISTPTGPHAALWTLDTGPPPDTSPPVTTDDAPTGWVNHAVTVTLSATDDASGVAATHYSLDGGPDQTGTSVAISGEGTHTLSYYSVDGARNAETPHSVTVRIDLTPPVVSYTGNAGTYAVDQTVTLDCNASDALSGVASDTCVDVSAPAWSFAPGEHTVSATATDNAGNTGSGSATFTVSVDYASLCALVRGFSTSPDVADGLCSKLDAAKAAAARGQPKSAQNMVDAFVSQVAAQTGKALADEDAALLTRLAASL